MNLLFIHMIFSSYLYSSYYYYFLILRCFHACFFHITFLIFSLVKLLLLYQWLLIPYERNAGIYFYLFINLHFIILHLFYIIFQSQNFPKSIESVPNGTGVSFSMILIVPGFINIGNGFIMLSGMAFGSIAGISVAVWITTTPGIAGGVGITVGVGIIVDPGMAVGAGIIVGVGIIDGVGIIPGAGTTAGVGIIAEVGTAAGVGTTAAVRTTAGVGITAGTGITVGVGIIVGVGTTAGVGIVAHVETDTFFKIDACCERVPSIIGRLVTDSLPSAFTILVASLIDPDAGKFTTFRFSVGIGITIDTGRSITLLVSTVVEIPGKPGITATVGMFVAAWLAVAPGIPIGIWGWRGDSIPILFVPGIGAGSTVGILGNAVWIELGTIVRITPVIAESFDDKLNPDIISKIDWENVPCENSFICFNLSGDISTNTVANYILKLINPLEHCVFLLNGPVDISGYVSRGLSKTSSTFKLFLKRAIIYLCSCGSFGLCLTIHCCVSSHLVISNPNSLK